MWPHTGIVGQTQTPAVTQSAHTHSHAKRYQVHPEHTKHTHAEAHVYADTTAEGSKHPGTCHTDVNASKVPRHSGSGHTQADTLHTRTFTHTATECLQAFHTRLPSLPTGPGSGVLAGHPWGVAMTEAFTAKAWRLDRILGTGRQQCSDTESGCRLLSQASRLPRQLVCHVEDPWAGVKASCSSVSVLSLGHGAPGALTPTFPTATSPLSC